MRRLAIAVVGLALASHTATAQTAAPRQAGAPHPVARPRAPAPVAPTAAMTAATTVPATTVPATTPTAPTAPGAPSTRAEGIRAYHAALVARRLGSSDALRIDDVAARVADAGSPAFGTEADGSAWA